MLMRRLDDEGGAVLVVVAVALPVFFLLMALVIDAGNWFTHERQLRNRADAGVQAAGLEYARQWARCTRGTPTEKATAATAIVAAAKSYAGANPSGGVSFNNEVTDVLLEDIVVNGGIETLCFPTLVTSTEVKVTERLVDSLFGSFGLPLGQTSETSRIELLQTASDTGFVPLAIEDQRIVKAQARFSNPCTGGSLGGPVTLTQLPSQTVPGMTLWGSPISITLPNAKSAGFPSCPDSRFDYEPISVEIRIASREEVDLNASCDALRAAPFADCFANITQVRAYACQDDPQPVFCDGSDDAGLANINDQPLVFDVSLSGGTCTADPYYARLAPGTSSCVFGAEVEMDWGDRQVDLSIPEEDNFHAELVVDGGTYQMELEGPDLRTLQTLTPVNLTSQGPDQVAINWRWRSTVGRSPDGVSCVVDPAACNQSGTIVIHRSNLADDPVNDTAPSDIVQLVRLSTNGTTDQSSLLDSVQATGNQVNHLHVVLGLRSELQPAQFAILRTRFRNDRTLVCDPAYSGGQTEAMVAQGCRPPFAPNALDPSSFWWNGSTCPLSGTWFSFPYTNTPWRCLRTEASAPNAQQLANGLATRTGNPGPTCDAPDRYLEYFETRLSEIDMTDRRLVKVFVIPFGGLKGAPDGTVPILEIAQFYVTDWGAPAGSPDDPCEPDANPNDQTSTPGRVAGYFVSTVSPNTGPTEPAPAVCDSTRLRPCRAVLVR
jgi:Flp pilus assembly protein TadG